MGLIISVPVGFIFTSYFGVIPDEVLSFFHLDGVCDSAKQGLNGHCWGDFFLPYEALKSVNPWASNPAFAYPPMGLFVWAPFLVLGNTFGENFALVCFLGAGLFAQVMPALDARYREKWISDKGMILVCAITLSSVGFLAVLDRGNNAIFLSPLVYYFVKYSQKQNLKLAFVFGLLIVALKPQLALLGIVIFAKWGVRKFALWILGSVASVFAPFALYGSLAIVNAKSFVHNFISFFGYGEYGAPYPLNLSLKNTLELGFNLLGLQRLDFLIQIANFTLATAALLYLVALAKKYSWQSSVFVTLSYLFVFSGTTFDYYLCLLSFFIIHIVSLTSEYGKATQTLSEIFETRSGGWATGLLLVLLTSPLLLPLSLFFPSVLHSPVSATLMLGKLLLPMALIVFLAFRRHEIKFVLADK